MTGTDSYSNITLLDGGMGRELQKQGAPFRQPEWSALALMERPDLVKKVHESFAKAGSTVLTTSNYAVVPFHIGEKRFLENGAHLTSLAGSLAKEVANEYNISVAGSIPPLFGSYRPDLFIPEQAPDLLKIIIDSLSPNVDLWIAETTSSIIEAEIVADALPDDHRKFWISYTLMDDRTVKNDIPCIRSGEQVTTAVRAAAQLGASAVLFNCSQPEAMALAVEAAGKELEGFNTEIPIGVYANAFPAQVKDARANSILQEIRSDLDPEGYLSFVKSWCELGVSIIGGCCGIGPEHIKMLKKYI